MDQNKLRSYLFSDQKVDKQPPLVLLPLLNSTPLRKIYIVYEVYTVYTSTFPIMTIFQHSVKLLLETKIEKIFFKYTK